MTPIPLADGLAAAPQPSADDFAALAAAGIRTVINNRPDGEDPGQLSAAEGERLAAEHGMAYRHLPVTGATLTREVVQSFGDTVSAAEGPVVAHCRTGTRSTLLWIIGEVLAGRMTADEIVPFGQARGLDLSAALTWLARERA